MTTTRDYYEILGIPRNVSDKELKSAYRKLALEWHPDRNKSTEAEKKFKEINEAYEVLSNPQKRQAYDQFGHAAFGQGAGFSAGGGPSFGWEDLFRQAGGQSGPFRVKFNYGNGGMGGFDFSDPFEIFEQFFGTASPFGRASRIPHVSISVDFMEAYKGVEKEVRVNGEKRKVRIPPGVDDGSRIQFSDFFVTVDVKPHPLFQRDGDDLYAQVEISLLLAIQGGDIKIPTPEGDVKVKVKPGTQPGSMVRLSGLGMFRLHGRGKGDLYIRLLIKIPAGKNLSKEQKELLQRLEK